MGQDHQKPESFREMQGSVPQAAQAFLTEHIPSHSDYEEFIASLAKYHLRRDASVGTSQDCGKRSLSRCFAVGDTPAKSDWIERDDKSFLICHPSVSHFCKVTVSLHQKLASFLRRGGNLAPFYIRGI
jgi:hypothetical protein